MKILIAIILSIVFIGCNTGEQKQFYFRSVGWKVSVPTSVVIEDSSSLYKPLPKAKDVQPLPDSVEPDQPHPPAERSNTTNTNINYGDPAQYDFPQKTLLRLSDSGGWRLGANTLIAAIEPIKKDGGTWDDRLRWLRAELSGGFTKSYLPAATVDSVYSTDIINKKEFTKTYFKVTRLNRTEHVEIYSRPINGYDFHCAIYYSDTAKGNLYREIFRKSKFDK